MLKKCLTCKNPDLGLLLLRLGLGSTFLYHGWIKLQNVAGTTGFFESLGLPAFLVYVVIAVELLGGAALILGILVEYAAWLIALDMVGAILLVRLGTGWAKMEFEILILLTAIAIALMGAGKYTVMEVDATKKK